MESSLVAVLDAPKHFAVALSTYDYAHLTIQRNQLRSIAQPGVVDEVVETWPDLHATDASAIGEADAAWAQARMKATAAVHVSQTIRNSLTGSGRIFVSLLECQLVRGLDSGWRVRSYRWVEPPEPPA